MTVPPAFSADVVIAAPGWAALGEDTEAFSLQVLAWAAAGMAAGGEAAVLLADDATLAQMNWQWRGKAAPTNVLSFPAGPGAPPGHLGDIALAYETVAAEALAQGKPLAAHTAHLLVHGLLHLLGYDHENEADAEAMEAIERRLLAEQGYPDPY